MKYEKVGKVYIPDNAYYTIQEMGNVIEVTYNSSYNSQPKIIKINSEEYYVVKTGEIRQFQHHSKNRSENIDSIRKTMKKIKDLIQTNVVDPRKAKFITLTYNVKMRDTKKVYNDFRKFNQKLQRFLKKKRIEKIEYIFVLEPQQNGSFHAHVIYIFQKKAPYISNDDISRMWGQGFTKTTNLDNVENVAVYLIAYLSDIEIPIEDITKYYTNEVKTVEVDGKEKAFIKGRRLHFYPRGVNIVRHSSGIKYPEKKRVSNDVAQRMIGDRVLTYHTAYRLSNDEGYTITIDKKEYRQFRKDEVR